MPKSLIPTCVRYRPIRRFKLETMKLHERREYKVDCNWKVYIDNFLEGYHLPSVHPGLNKELDYSQYNTAIL